MFIFLLEPFLIYKSPSICFRGTNSKIYCKMLLNLHSLLWCRAWMWFQLFASTVVRFLSLISYLPSYVFLRRCRSFTLRKWYSLSREIPMFLAAIWSSLYFSSLMYRFIPSRNSYMCENGRFVAWYPRLATKFVWCIVTDQKFLCSICYNRK